ncbi:MAG TPA: UDP-glucose/GDP-mannose dehydrogenase family protein [Phycisphaerae bacterium]|jgi:UDPglucose 6-dehydrogenase|nr:UDP-glucose/GDP-mannose dehydrogenase family protein [Phycisphaerae bacterium]
MDIAVIGCGYVGLVSGVCLASLGHKVTAVDVDESKVKALRSGVVPIYEPGLSELIKNEVAAGRLNFDTDTGKATRDAKTIFLAVGTPPAKEGGYDLGYLFSAAEMVAKFANGPKTLVIKSTVNPGTGSKVQALVNKLSQHKIEVVNNPEFLREGTAIQDFMQPDRIVFGAGCDAGLQTLRAIYQPLIDKGYEIFCMSRESAELTKFSANAMLALRISFINEISQLAQAIGADIESVRIGIGTDKRIGPSFLKAGVGYGGSCFPKDVQALVHQMKTLGIEALLLSGIESANTRQKKAFGKRILETIKGTPNPVIAVWGLAFKSDTDDIREAPAFEIIKALAEGGATVKTFDPQAMENSRKYLGNLNGKVIYCRSVAEATQDADAVALVTEWNEFITQDWAKVAKLMRGKHIFDGRNCLASKMVADAGLYYHAVGRPEVKPGEGKTGTIGTVSAGS